VKLVAMKILPQISQRSGTILRQNTSVRRVDVGRDSNCAPPEYKSRSLPLCQHARRFLYSSFQRYLHLQDIVSDPVLPKKAMISVLSCHLQVQSWHCQALMESTCSNHENKRQGTLSHVSAVTCHQ
jgi:hypothetical protein